MKSDESAVKPEDATFEVSGEEKQNVTKPKRKSKVFFEEPQFINIRISEGDLVTILFNVLWFAFGILILVLCDVIDYLLVFAPADVDGSVYILLRIAEVFSKVTIVLLVIVDGRWLLRKALALLQNYYKDTL